MALRYAVGIDLGTSNTAIAYAHLEAKDPGASVEIFPLPQLVAAGEVTARPLLPSHLYLPGDESATMAIIAVSQEGMLSVLGTVPTVEGAHCVTSDVTSKLTFAPATFGTLCTRAAGPTSPSDPNAGARPWRTPVRSRTGSSTRG